MRFDLPHDLPRPRRNEPVPLTPSPLEQRRERLMERATENRGPKAPLPRTPKLEHDHPRVDRERSVSPSRPLDRTVGHKDQPCHYRPSALRCVQKNKKFSLR